MNNPKVNTCVTTAQVMKRSIFSPPGAPCILSRSHPSPYYLFFIVALPMYSFLNKSFSFTCFWPLYSQIMFSVVFYFLYSTLCLYVIMCPHFYYCIAAFHYMNLLHVMYLLMDVWFISSLGLLWCFRYLIHFFWSPCAWISSGYRSRNGTACHRVYISSTLPDNAKLSFKVSVAIYIPPAL